MILGLAGARRAKRMTGNKAAWHPLSQQRNEVSAPQQNQKAKWRRRSSKRRKLSSVYNEANAGAGTFCSWLFLSVPQSHIPHRRSATHRRRPPSLDPRSRVVVVQSGLVWFHAIHNGCWAAAPITSLSVTLRGQRYDIDQVTTVRDLQEKLEQQSGIQAKQQGRIIFGGKSLAPDTVLEEAGVPNDGSASLTIVPAANPSSSSSKTKKKASSSAKKSTTTTASKRPSSSSMSSGGIKISKDASKMPSFDKSRVEEMMQKMGGEGMPSLEESIKSMSEAMVRGWLTFRFVSTQFLPFPPHNNNNNETCQKNPMVQQMLSDPEKLEQMRKMILLNPMLKSMMGNMPGFDDLLNDPDAFREAMQASADLYKSMDSDTLLNSMMGGAAAASGNLFDGSMDNSASALDELDEDD